MIVDSEGLDASSSRKTNFFAQPSEPYRRSERHKPSGEYMGSVLYPYMTEPNRKPDIEIRCLYAGGS